MLGSAEAELYLRMLVERVLVDGVRRRDVAGVMSGCYTPCAAAAALVAVGAIKQELAEDVLIDFDLACTLRGGGGPGVANTGPGATVLKPPPSAPRKALKPPRVAPCRAEFHLPWGKVKVHHVLLSDELTTIGITASMTSTGSVARSDRRPIVHVSVRDDQGTTVTASFGGMFVPGKSYALVLTCDLPLYCRTRWIEFDGGRIDLPEADQVAPEVRLEELPQTDPALAHLWRRLATTEMQPIPVSYDIESAIEALVAVGALDADSAELDQLRNVAATMGSGWRTFASGAQPAHSPVRLPEPWHSLAAARRKVSGQGPIGVLGVGAVTPPVDETVVLVDTVVFYPATFTLNVTITPATSPHPPYPRPIFYSPGNPLAWWAEDDCGGVYWGVPGISGGGPDYSRGAVGFLPGLDARCRELRILPTGQTQRAVIPINVCWEET